MNLGVLRSTQAFALFVAAVVVAVLVFLFATGQFESDDEEDPLALPTETTSRAGGGRWWRRPGARGRELGGGWLGAGG